MIMEILVDDVFFHMAMCFCSFHDDIIVKWRAFVCMLRLSQTCKRLYKIFGKDSRVWLNLYHRDISTYQDVSPASIYGNALMEIGNIRINNVLRIAATRGYNKAVDYCFLKGGVMNQNIAYDCLKCKETIHYVLTWPGLIVDETIVDILIENSNLDVLKILWPKRIQFDQDNLLYKAFSTFKPEIVECLISLGLTLTQQQKGRLCCSPREGFLDLYIKAGVNIEPQYYCFEDCETLYSRGFDVNANNGQLLINVCKEEYLILPQCVMKLLFLGADPTLQDNQAVKILIARKEFAVAEMLVNNGADPSFLEGCYNPITKLKPYSNIAISQEIFVRTLHSFVNTIVSNTECYQQRHLTMELFSYIIDNSKFIIDMPDLFDATYTKLLDFHTLFFNQAFPRKELIRASKIWFTLCSIYASNLKCI